VSFHLINYPRRSNGSPKGQWGRCCCKLARNGAGALLNPKAETRRSKETRNPKTERGCKRRHFRVSTFGLLSAFGFRTSDLRGTSVTPSPHVVLLRRGVSHGLPPFRL